MYQLPSHINLVFDFDSTFVSCESLDFLAASKLDRKEQKMFESITSAGMAGKLSFHASLQKRIAFVNATRTDVRVAANHLQDRVSDSIKRYEDFFRDHSDNVYIVSGGFTELILPVVESYGINPEHVYANTFVYNTSGSITGVDESNPSAHDNGKVEIVRSLRLPGQTIIIGDGYTDYQVRLEGVADSFIAYTENVYRDAVVQYADFEAQNFDVCLECLLKI